MSKTRSVAATANDNSIPGSRIESGTLEGDKLSGLTVTSANIANGAIDDAKVDSNAAIEAAKLRFQSASSGGVARTVQSKLADSVHVRDFGAVGDGVADDSDAIQAAIFSPDFSVIDFSGNLSYRITKTIILNNNKTLNCYGARFSGDTGNTPYFYGKNRINVTINGGAFYAIKCSDFIKIEGNYADSGSQYSRQIYLNNIWLEAPDCGTALTFRDGVRQVFVNSCTFLCQNGMSMTDKQIETQVTNCLFFCSSSSGNAGTVGVKLLTAGSSSSLSNEGVLFVNNHVDFYEKGFQINSCFVFGVSQGYYGGTLKAIEYLNPTVPAPNTLTRHNWSNCTINNIITVGSFSNGRESYLNWTGCNFTGHKNGPSFSFGGNVYNCAIIGCSFNSSFNCPHAVVCNTNSGGIMIHSNFVDATYPNGFRVLGSTSLRPNSIFGNNYTGPGATIDLVQRPTFTGFNNIASATDGAREMPSFQLPTGTYFNGGTVLSSQRILPKGRQGVIMGTINYSSAAPGNFVITTPAGTVRPQGSGWDSKNLRASGTGTINFSIPFYTSADLTTGTPFTITWESGSGSATVDADSWASIIFNN